MASQKKDLDQACNSDQGESGAQLSKTLSAKLSNLNLKQPSLSSVALKGDEKLVSSFLSESVSVTGDPNQVKQSQLYIAAFWGIADVIKTLLDSGCNVNHQNEGSLWTPLHAATFQEHGKVVMLLLEYKANPELEDSVKRTPIDFASASLKIWPHFAALGYSRTPKQNLIDKGIICKIDSQKQNLITKDGGIIQQFRPAAYTRPGSSYMIKNPALLGNCDINIAGSQSNGGSGGMITRRARGAQMDSRAMAACLSGDVLAADSPQEQRGGGGGSSKKMQLGIWRSTMN